MFSMPWKRSGGRAALVRLPKRARQGQRLLAELLEDRTVLSSGRGGLESLSSALQVDTSSQAHQGRSAQPAIVPAADTTAAQSLALPSQSISLHPSGPGYPVPPANGPVLRGDLLATAPAASVPLPSQQSTASVLPLLLVGGGLSAPTGAAVDIAATTSLLAPQGVAAGVPVTPAAPSVPAVSAATVSAPTANQATAAPTQPSPIVAASGTGVAAQTVALTASVASDVQAPATITVPAVATADSVAAPGQTTGLAASVASLPVGVTLAAAGQISVSPLAAAQAPVATIAHTEGTEGTRAVATAHAAPTVASTWIALAQVTTTGSATLVSSTGVVSAPGLASAAAQASARTDAEPAEATLLDLLFASATSADARGAEQAVMAGELAMVATPPTAIAESGGTGETGERVATASTAALIVPGTALDRLFAEQGDETQATGFGGVRFLVPLLLAAGVGLAARRRVDDTAEPRVRLRATAI